MIENALRDLTIDDVRALVTAGRSEGRTLDFKEAPPATFSDAEKKELARDVSSFANAGGGDIVFGVEETAGIATGAPGFECTDPDKLMLQVEAIIRDNIEPRVPVEMRRVDGFAGGRIGLVIRVPRSWNAPHMVRGTPLFYSRANNGKQPLDVRQIRAAFNGSADVARRARSFRDERLGRIVADETPLPLLRDQRARLVTHVVPLIPEEEASLDLVAIQRSMAMLPPRERGTSHRYNLDGFVTFPAMQGLSETDVYFQAFRIGAFESVRTMPLLNDHDATSATPRLLGFWIEQEYVETIAIFLQALTSLGVVGSVAAMLTLVNVKGCRVRGDEEGFRISRAATIDRDVVTLPDVVFENDSEDVTTLLRSSFDVLWQASGWERSPGYDSNGNWIKARHNG